MLKIREKTAPDASFGNEMKISKRGAVSPFLIMEVFRDANDLQAQGESVIHLSLGQPGRPTPAPILEKAKQIMDADRLGYTEAAGLRPLRRRIQQHYQAEYGKEVPLERIFVTIGSSCGFMMAALAAFDAGDRVGIAVPCYPAYPNMLDALGVEVVRLEATPQTRFQPTVEMLEQAGPLDGLIIASPSNPAGTVLDRKEMQALVDYCEAQGIRIFSDEIYHRVSFDKPAETILNLTDSAVVLNSFSKYFLMPGWRLGWAVIPEDMVRSFDALTQNFFISPAALAQYVALEAFDAFPLLDQVVEEYRNNRDIMVEGLPRAGFRLVSPAEGAFYLYADISDIAEDSRDFCHRMLHETGVCAVPGYDFDPKRGGRYIRFSYSLSTAEVQDAVERILAWRGVK